jgi:hypothetical protein
MKKLVFLIAFLSSFFAKAQYYGVQFDSAFVAYKDSNNIFTQQNKFNLPVLIPSVPTVPFHAASKFYVDQEIINANVEEVILKGIPPTPLTLFVTKYYVDTTGADVQQLQVGSMIYIKSQLSTQSGIIRIFFIAQTMLRPMLFLTSRIKPIRGRSYQTTEIR